MHEFEITIIDPVTVGWREGQHGLEEVVILGKKTKKSKKGKKPKQQPIATGKKGK